MTIEVGALSVVAIPIFDPLSFPQYFRIGRSVEDVYKIITPIVIHLSSQMACDILITLGMVHRVRSNVIFSPISLLILFLSFAPSRFPVGKV
jgi:hypothetical protein